MAPPAASHRFIARLRLIGRMRTGSARLIMVTAEPGTGKTTLLSQLAETIGAAAWYGARAEDDGDRFCHNLCETLCAVYPGVGTLRGTRSPGACLEAISRRLASDICDYAHPVDLLIDDIHHAVDVQLISGLLRSCPPNLKVYVSCREIPDLPVEWLRSKGMVVEIGEAELRFTAPETEQLLLDVWQCSLEEDLLWAVQERTCGWITALQLAADALQELDADGRRQYISRLDGGERRVHGYLLREVYGSLPSEVKAMLRRTSILKRIDASAALDLGGWHDAVSVLRRLASQRMFVSEVDEDSFAYHPMFARFLQVRLEEEESVDDLADLVVRGRPHLLRCGYPDLFERFLARMPEPLMKTRPTLRLLWADILCQRGEGQSAIDGYRELLVEQTESVREEAVEGLIRASARFTDPEEVDRIIASAEPVEGLSGAGRGRLLCWLGALRVYAGDDWVAGYTLLERGREAARKARDEQSMAWGLSLDGFVRLFPQGQFRRAEDALSASAARFKGLGDLSTYCHVLVQQGLVHLTRGDVAGAALLIQEVDAVRRKFPTDNFTRHAHIMNQAHLALLQKNHVRAASELALISEAGLPAQLKAWYLSLRVDLAVARCSRRSAEWEEGELRRHVAAAPGLYAPASLLSLARAAMARQAWGEASALLHEADEICEAGDCRYWRMQVQFLLAAVRRAERRTHTQLVRGPLKRALELSSTDGYDEFWMQQDPERSVPLLADAVALGVEIPQAVRLTLRLGEEAHALLTRLGGDRRECVGRAAEFLLQQRRAASRMEIRTLGGLTVARDGKPVRIRGRMAQRILSILLARLGRVVALDEICDAMYESVDGDKARRNVVDHFRRLVVQVGYPGLRRRGDGLVFEGGDGLWCDADEFGGLVREGLRLRGEGNVQEAALRMEQALGLYRGAFLSGDAYDDPPVMERRRHLADLANELLRVLPEEE